MLLSHYLNLLSKFIKCGVSYISIGYTFNQEIFNTHLYFKHLKIEILSKYIFTGYMKEKELINPQTLPT
jgi:hypothetical protein